MLAGTMTETVHRSSEVSFDVEHIGDMPCVVVRHVRDRFDVIVPWTAIAYIRRTRR